MKIPVALGLFLLISLPVIADKAMMFNNVDQYIERSNHGIWIVEVVKPSALPMPTEVIGPAFETKMLRVLQGDALTTSLLVKSDFQHLNPGNRYLFFGFNATPATEGGVFIDNGNISPVEIPASFSLAQLDGKSPKEQIELILMARSAEIDAMVKRLAEDKKAIDDGLESQKREDQSKGSQH